MTHILSRLTRLVVAFVALTAISCSHPVDYTVLQWNIWQEGTKVPGGYDAIVNEITRLQPDFVTLSEVRNYRGVDFTARLVEDVAGKGVTYYTAPSYDSGLLSRYPIEQFDTIFPENGDHGSIYRLYATTPAGHRFAVYTAHLDYQNCTYYEPRGYSGVDWSECEIPASVEEIIEKNDRSLRDDAVRVFIKAANADVAEGRIVILGGDFNEPSHLDWSQATAGMRDHAGFAVPWTVSTLLAGAGFTDAYRAVYPDAIENPCFTFPSANNDVAPEKLTWAPKSDERDRIDFIYYKAPDADAATVVEAAVFGPRESVDKARVVADPGNDSYILPLGVWPTDHKGVLVKLKCK